MWVVGSLGRQARVDMTPVSFFSTSCLLSPGLSPFGPVCDSVLSTSRHAVLAVSAMLCHLCTA